MRTMIGSRDVPSGSVTVIAEEGCDVKVSACEIELDATMLQPWITAGKAGIVK